SVEGPDIEPTTPKPPGLGTGPGLSAVERLAGKLAPLAIVGDLLLVYQLKRQIVWISGGYDKDNSLPLGSNYVDFYGDTWEKTSMSGRGTWTNSTWWY